MFFLVFRYYAIARPLDYHETMTGMEDCWLFAQPHFFKNVAICKENASPAQNKSITPRTCLASTFVGVGGISFWPYPSLSLIQCMRSSSACFSTDEQLFTWTAFPHNWYPNSSLPSSFWYQYIIVSARSPKYMSFILQYSNPQGRWGGQFFLSIPCDSVFTMTRLNFVYAVAHFFPATFVAFPRSKFGAFLFFTYFDFFSDIN